MKKHKITFWITTTIIFLFEGVMPALTSHTEMARAAISHLGYPAYFGPMLMIFKVSGTIALIIPAIPRRVKEWAYAGLAFDFIAASVSNSVVDGFGFNTFFPLIFLGILILSYISLEKIDRYSPSSSLQATV